MAVVSVPRNMSRACKLYLARKYEEGDKIMSKITEPAHQKAAIEAQLALFSWDLDKAAERCMEFLPYIDEWYSGNMLEAGFAMITFCGYKADKEKVLSYLTTLKDDFSSKSDDNIRTERIISVIKGSVNTLNGGELKKKYTPPEEPVSLNEAVSYLKEKFHSDFTPDTPDGAQNILSRMYHKMDPVEYIGCYERFSDSPKLTEITRADAIKMYIYSDMPDKEKILKAVCGLYKYSWLPVEKTTVMPISILTYDVRLWDYLDKETFDYIYKTPSIYFGGQ